MNASARAPISARSWLVDETELVSLVTQGHTDTQIATQLYISVRTVRSHLDRSGTRPDTGAARWGDAHLMAVNVWVALHGIVSLRTSRPSHPWPPVDTLINAALSGQTGLDYAPE